MSKKIIVSTGGDINAASSGDNTIIAANADKRIHVWKMWLVGNASVNLKFKSGSNEFNAFAVPLTAQGANITFAYDDEPYWICNKGEAFVINLSGAVQITGRIYYTYEF
jgi:hypothetical protein